MIPIPSSDPPAPADAASQSTASSRTKRSQSIDMLRDESGVEATGDQNDSAEGSFAATGKGTRETHYIFANKFYQIFLRLITRSKQSRRSARQTFKPNQSLVIKFTSFRSDG